MERFDGPYDFMYDIDTVRFYRRSNTQFMECKRGIEATMMAVIKNGDLKGTYLEWLPIELLLIIFKIAQMRAFQNEKEFYRDYFSQDQSERKVIRHLRLRPGDEENAKTDIRIRIGDMMMPDGEIVKCRKIFKNNPAQMCYQDFAEALMKEPNAPRMVSLEQLNKIYHCMKQWTVWMCDHYYRPEWARFLRILVTKVTELYDSILRIGYNITHRPENNSPEALVDFDEKKRVIHLMRYFITDYIPFALLSRGNAFLEARREIFPRVRSTYDDNVADILFLIFEVTGRHPDDIDIIDVNEFEMMSYAPDYFYDVYENFMVLRNGKTLVPDGQMPHFFWDCDRYIQRLL